MSKVFCKRCLMDEVLSEAEYIHMKEYISAIDDYIKSSDEEYKRRLNICKECDLLINGMCKLCGCFVEIRAAVKKNYCPNKNRYW
ncbi:DUF6171 family protein [Clostridium sp. AL.422]|uniref:DUF6171 family protein n=1 Tax=Clostridium TaxID=1485 RepID=UPI00293DCE3A|nr:MULTISPECIES: DUF6171 family protein [unclassified Clostridium]MDV4150880.1 DUF6171 family protein [Clostridium sp. AL.422]